MFKDFGYPNFSTRISPTGWYTHSLKKENFKVSFLSYLFLHTYLNTTCTFLLSSDRDLTCH